MRKAYAVIVTIVAVISLIGNYLEYMRYSSSRPIITVNNQVIRRKDLDDRLDYEYTNSVLREMIYNDLIMQAAAKEGVTPTQADVDNAYNQLLRASPSVIDEARKTDPLLVVFKEQLKGQLALDNLRVKGIQVSDAEVESYYEAHRKQFALPEQSTTILVLAPDTIGAQTAQRMLENNVTPAVIAESNGLRVIGVNAQIHGQLPLYIGRSIMAMKPGQVKVFPILGQFLVAKVQSVAGQKTLGLQQIRPQVEMAARLAKAPSDQKVLGQLRESAHIVADTGKYAGAIPPAPGEQVASAGQ